MTSRTHSLAELTVIFSVKIDSPDRLENLKYNLAYFEAFFTDYEIIVVEQDAAPQAQPIAANREGVRYYFIPSESCHYKTRNLNFATHLATRPVVMMSDVDVICPPLCLVEAVGLVRQGHPFVSPHNGLLVEIKKEFFGPTTPQSLVDQLLYFPKDYDLRMGDFDFTSMQPLYGESYYDSTGGCILYRKQDFYLIGGWNTNFVSYGYEDMEFVYRLTRLGYTLRKMDHCNIYHLEHKRLQDSYYSTSFFRSNEQEWMNVRAMTAEELRGYALNGFRKTVFTHAAEVVVRNTRDEFSVRVLQSGKIDLSGLSVVIPLYVSKSIYLFYLEALLNYFETYFNNFEIVMVEGEHRNCKYLNNKSNTRYFWLGLNKFDLNAAIAKGVSECSRDLIAIWGFFSLVEPGTLLEKIRLLRESDQVHQCRIADAGWKDKISDRSRIARLGNALKKTVGYFYHQDGARRVSGVTLIKQQYI